MASEVQKLFERLPKLFQKGNVKSKKTYYFSLGEEKWTVVLSKDSCVVKPEKTEDADCFFKASTEMFLDVWNGKHTPTVTDFVTGAIKSNNPLMLKEFVAAFRKS